MTKSSRPMVAIATAGALAVSAVPVQAADRNGIDADDVIAGALIIGGIAAVAAAVSNNGDDRYDYGYRDRSDRWGGRWGQGNSRAAVDQCVRAAESSARRYSYGRADVIDIRKVTSKRNGYNVNGRIAVDHRGSGWRGNDWRRNGQDTGSFTCKVRYGRVTDVDFSGLRRLR